MRRFVKITLFFSGIVAVMSFALWYAFPGFFLDSAMAAYRWRIGLSAKTVVVGDHTVAYLDGGSGETVLLLHGFASEADHWLRFAGHLLPGYRLVIPDLPGFGRSTYRDAADYSNAAQARRVKALVDALGLRHFHLAGISMGGNIAGTFTAAYPELPASLALFDAAGVNSPVKSGLARLREQGINIFTVETAADFDRFIGFSFVRPPFIPGPVKRVLIERMRERGPRNDRIYKQLHGDLFALEGNLPRITAPTLVLWGDADRIIDVSCAAVFAKGIRNSTVSIIRRCGHAPIFERPAESAGIYRDFLRSAHR